MSENSGQRYCGNCGAKLRVGTSFCVSCGTSLAPKPDPPASSYEAAALDSESQPEGREGSTGSAQGEPEAVQRKPLGGWVIVVVGLVILIGAIYGINSGSGEVGDLAHGSTVEEQSSSLQDTSTSGYSDYEMAERKIRAEIRTQMDTSSPGYFRYIYYEEPGAPTEMNDEIRSNVLAEYGFDCRPIGGGAMDNGRGGGVYQWIYDCNYVGTEDVGEWSDIY